MEINEPVTQPVLSVENLSLVRGRRCLYEDLTVSFDVGVTAILGPNGAGKTTLLEGLLDPGRARRGRVLFEGASVPDQVPLPTFLSRVGHMPQDWKYFAGFTVQESVEYAAWLKGVPSRQLRQVAAEAIDDVDLSKQRHVKVRRLSGGMRQRVGLAETFVNTPRLVLLDEPTVGLDPAQRALLREHIRASATDRAVITSTHLTDDVEAIASRVLVIDEATLVFDGTPAELAARAEGQFGHSSPLEAGYLAVLSPLARAGTN